MGIVGTVTMWIERRMDEAMQLKLEKKILHTAKGRHQDSELRKIIAEGRTEGPIKVSVGEVPGRGSFGPCVHW